MRFPLYHLYVEAIAERNAILLVIAAIVIGMLSLQYLSNEAARNPRFALVPKVIGTGLGVIYYASLVAVGLSLRPGP